MGMSFLKVLKSLTAIILVAAMQLPIAVKISHALYEHVEVECDDFASLHIHETEFDCDYQKFNLSTNCIVPEFETIDNQFLIFLENDFSTYSFQSKYQKLHFFLRGPPSIS